MPAPSDIPAGGRSLPVAVGIGGSVATLEANLVRPQAIRDIGLIQMFLGAAFVVGMLRPASRVALWAAATVWLIAHALLHFWEVAVGICAPSALARDFPAVTLPALIGIALTVWAWRNCLLKERPAA